MRRRPPFALILACAAYLVLRGLVLARNFDAVCLPSYELALGNIAHLLLEGWAGAPLHQHYDNCGGHLVTGILAAPLFGLLGESYLALKLVPVLLGLATLVLGWSLLDRHFGRRAANLAAFLFALGPPTLVKYSMLAKGNHFENLPFQLAVLWIFYRMHSSPRKERWMPLFGLASGFAIFFYFGSMALAALLGAMHLGIRGLRRGFADLARILPGFAVGIAPLAWVWIGAGERPGGFLGAKLGGEHRPPLGRILERLAELWTDLLPRAGCFEDLGPIPGRVAEGLFFAAFLGAWASLLPALAAGVRRALRRSSALEGAARERERFDDLKLWPLVAYLPFVSLAFAASTFEFKPYGAPLEVGQFRYLVPHFALATLVFGAALEGGLRQAAGARRRLAVALSGAALACGLFTLPIVDSSFAHPGLGSAYAGYYLPYYNNVVARDTWRDPATNRVRWDEARVVRQISDLPRAERADPYFGVGYHAAYSQLMPLQKGSAAGLDLAALLAPYPAEHHVDLARGAGSHLRFLAARGGRAEVRAALAASAGHPLAPAAVEGLCIPFEFPLARTTRARLAETRTLGELCPPGLAAAWVRGQGLQVGRLLARGIQSDVAAALQLAELQRPDERQEFWRGVGIGIASAAAPDARGRPAALDTAPAELAGACRAGFESELRGRGGE